MRDFIKIFNKYQMEYQNICEELKNSPEGRLMRRGNFFTQVIDNKEVGITNNIPLIKALCRKKYLEVRKKILKQNLAATTRSKKFIDIKPETIISGLPATYQGLPIHYFYHPSVEAFLAQGHSRNNYKPENLHYHSNNGTLVRSKSETIIANELEAYQIPYLYELPLKLGSQIKSPDFTTMCPFSGKIVLWEHYGALHLQEYEENMTNKMLLYMKQGYQPFETIIYTFEFDIKNIHRIRELIEQVILG